MAGCGREGAAAGWKVALAGAEEEGQKKRSRSNNIIFTYQVQGRGGQKVTSKAPFKMNGARGGSESGRG